MDTAAYGDPWHGSDSRTGSQPNGCISAHDQIPPCVGPGGPVCDRPWSQRGVMASPLFHRRSPMQQPLVEGGRAGDQARCSGCEPRHPPAETPSHRADQVIETPENNPSPTIAAAAAPPVSIALLKVVDVVSR